MFDIKNCSKEMKYQLLRRMQSDCKYYLGFGNRSPKRLWSGNEKDHITDMKEIYNNLEIKPEWITIEEINKYGELMGVNNND